MYRDAEQRNFACTLRNNMTPAERRRWQLLRAEQMSGFKFRRQAAVGAYIVDFVCFSHKLAVELDGPQHATDVVKESDERRTQWLASQGFRVLRFWNHQVNADIHSVLDTILKSLDAAEPFITPPPSPTLPTRGRGPE